MAHKNLLWSLFCDNNQAASRMTKLRGISSTSFRSERSNYAPIYYYKNDHRHLKTGSSCPPLPVETVRIYSMRFCPYAQRSILVALAKAIPHDVVNCNLKDKPEWLWDKNPLGKVPIIEFPDGKRLCESLVVSDYFDEVYNNKEGSSRPLHSLDPYHKAIDRLWINRFDTAIAFFYKALGAAVKRGDMTSASKNLALASGLLETLDKEWKARGTKYFGGDEFPGMLDYMIWPWMERMPALRSLLPAEVLKMPTILESWRENMLQDFAVKEFLLPIEVHSEFMTSLLSGSPNYDLLNVQMNAKL